MVENETIRERIKFYFDNNIEVHITINDERFTFYNGIIKSINLTHIIIKDRKVGEVPIFYSEIINVEPTKAR